MDSFDFIENLKTQVYCRLKASPIHGVGVFAIKTIPAGIDPLQEKRGDVEFTEIGVDCVINDGVPHPIQRLVIDMCPQEGDTFAVPPFSLNEIGLSYYINHSKTPNMEEREGYFFTMREIQEGEELTVDYGTYGDLNL